MELADSSPLSKITYDNAAQCRRRLIKGPPPFYFGPRPPISCELYITNLPVNLDITLFYKWLQRCGVVYEMRLMMNPEKNETRGYGFVRFFEIGAAITVFELLPFLFLNGKRPSAQASHCKRQLYVGNIPKSLSLADIRDDFKKILPTLISCKAYAPAEAINGFKNRGFAFLEFVEHDNALEAKKILKTKRVWNQYIRVDWARPNEQENEENSQRVEVFGNLRKNDYCAKLRLYSLANDWCIPIVLYGSNFRHHEVQYGSVLIKETLSGNYSCIIVEAVGFSRVFDIHLMICEVATHLVECICGMPPKNYVVRVRNGSTAKILYSFREIDELINFSSNRNAFISPASVISLFQSLELLGQYQSETILNNYKKSFRTEIAAVEHLARFCLIDGIPCSYFYSIYPKFRDNYSLNNNFNDTEIVLLLATATCDNTVCMSLDDYNELLNSRFPDEGAFVLKSQRYNCHANYKLDYIDVNLLKWCAFYHPSQKINSPPLWVRGETYQTSIFETLKI